MTVKFFRGWESEWQDFTTKYLQEKLNFIVQLGAETIAKAQTHQFELNSAFQLSSRFVALLNTDFLVKNISNIIENLCNKIKIINNLKDFVY